ncbi:MAG: GNAT family N-acetyltransferase [Candidatus Jordarchaeaceae archaeon]
MFYVRKIEKLEHFEKCSELEKLVWGTEESTPTPLLIALQHNGGLLLGAFDDNENLVGFCLGFTSRKDNQLYFYAHQVGVHPEFQNLGVGYQLMMKQREYAIRMGFNLMKWTFDPLQGLNGNFNIRKLGVICHTYNPNYYGKMRDGLNAGMPSDRFTVEWWLKSKRVVNREQGKTSFPSLRELLSQGIETANQTEIFKKGIRRITKTNLNLDSERILVEIPESIRRVKETSMDLAIEWCEKIRPIFLNYFERGYVASDFISAICDGERRNFYLLLKSYLLEDELK